MKNIWRIFSALLFLGLSLSWSKAFASILVPPKNYSTWQAGERAVLVWENQQETLVLSPKIQGDKTNFVWLIPTPNQPEIQYVSQKLFTNLDQISQNQHEIFPNFAKTPKLDLKDSEIYKTEVFKFISSTEILNWLQEKNYYLPSSSQYLLDNYLKNEWYFTTVEVDLSKIKNTGVFLPPIQLSFSSSKLVYPILLKSFRLLWQNEATSQNQENPEEIAKVEEQLQNGETDFNKKYQASDLPKKVNLDLYIFAENKQTQKSLKITYADWLSASKIKNLAKNSEDSPWYSTKNPKLFFTKGYMEINYSAFSQDLEFSQANNNDPIEKGRASSGKNLDFPIWLYPVSVVAWLILLLISPIGLGFALGIYLTRVESSKMRKATGIFFEILTALILLSTILANYFLLFQNYLEKLGWSSLQFSWDSKEYSLNQNQIFKVGLCLATAQILVLVWMLISWILQSRKKATLVSADGKNKKILNNHEEIGEHIFPEDAAAKKNSESEFEVELEKAEARVPEKPRSIIAKSKTTKVKVNKE